WQQVTVDADDRVAPDLQMEVGCTAFCGDFEKIIDMHRNPPGLRPAWMWTCRKDRAVIYSPIYLKSKNRGILGRSLKARCGAGHHFKSRKSRQWVRPACLSRPTHLPETDRAPPQ